MSDPRDEIMTLLDRARADADAAAKHVRAEAWTSARLNAHAAFETMLAVLVTCARRETVENERVRARLGLSGGSNPGSPR